MASEYPRNERQSVAHPTAWEDGMAQQIDIKVDGVTRPIEVDDPTMPLLYALRDELGLNNPRFGCGLGQCGACTVHIDGVPTRSCLTPLAAVGGSDVTTLAGLGTPEHPHPLQAAWITEEASQCGYCMNGWIMTGAALLKRNPHPSDAEIREALVGLKCRCGTHLAIIRAIKRASQAA
jgi:aerobic-type carbon monoxide dehydrogenase small subunit (CoxS/CutS family)